MSLKTEYFDMEISWKVATCNNEGKTREKNFLNGF
jgi:hypothetical protein